MNFSTKIAKKLRAVRPHWCWWRIMETFYFAKFEMLPTDYLHWSWASALGKSHQNHLSLVILMEKSDSIEKWYWQRQSNISWYIINISSLSPTYFASTYTVTNIDTGINLGILSKFKLTVPLYLYMHNILIYEIFYCYLH